MSSRLRQRPGKSELPAGEIALGDRLISPWEDEAGVRAFLRDRAGARCEFYGSGKVALRDALDILAAHADSHRTNVVLPAYVPSALLEPIKEAGYEPRPYRITRQLRPDLGDVEAQLDSDTLAVVSVNYFGLPQPDHAALVGHAADYDVPLIEDNAHSALSMTPEGTLLGTRGDVGFTSFRKTLPVPNGAALFIWRDGLRDGPYPRSGIRRRPTVGDGRFVVGWLARRFGPGWSSGPSDRTSPDALSGGRDLHGRDPVAVYRRATGPMSYLTATVLDHLRPGKVVAAKRRNYQHRRTAVSGLQGTRPVYGELPPGTCPQAYPVLVEDVEELARRLDRTPGSLPRWPPLPVEVATDRRYETAQYLAEHLVPLPV